MDFCNRMKEIEFLANFLVRNTYLEFNGVELLNFIPFCVGFISDFILIIYIKNINCIIRFFSCNLSHFSNSMECLSFIIIIIIIIKIIKFKN